mgnify:CR=1 FL=1
MNSSSILQKRSATSPTYSVRTEIYMESDRAFDVMSVIALTAIAMHDAQGALIALTAYALVVSARSGIGWFND